MWHKIALLRLNRTIFHI